MLDLHALSSGGGTTLTNIGTILLGGDGQTAAGVPIGDGALLRAWGQFSIVATRRIREARLLTPDMVDDQNGEYYVLGTSSSVGAIFKRTAIPYRKGARVLAQRQNGVAGNNIGYTLDQYNDPRVPIVQGIGYPHDKNIVIRTVFGSALTAIQWGTQAFNPTTVPPQGRYALLGAWVHALTDFGLLRFTHKDFVGYKPGFPVKDDITLALNRATESQLRDPLWTNPGYQFLALGDIPIFTIQSTGTGLTMEMAAISGDTPDVHLNLKRVGD